LQKCAGSEEYSESQDYSTSETTTSEGEQVYIMQVATVDRINARRVQWFGYVSRMDRMRMDSDWFECERIPYLALHKWWMECGAEVDLVRDGEMESWKK